MRYLTFSLPADGTLRTGIVDGTNVIEISTALLDFIRRGPIDRDPGLGIRDPKISSPESGVPSPESRGRAYPLSEIRWHAPIPRPGKNIFCVGRNYVAHIKEGAAAYKREMKLPEVPVFFTKSPTAVIGPFDDVPRHAALTEQLDWEAELAVVIGRPGRNISRADALAHVFGYTAANDITARDLQQRHMQWFKGKSLDGSCPIGPVIVTADEFGDPQNKRVTLRINGVTKQDGSTADMIFPIDVIIEWLSQGLTLEAGDIIATGTPDGVGMGRVPQEWLQDGDVVETEVEGVGVMRNTVRDS